MKVLMFISDTGAGHRSVAEAISQELAIQTNGRAECQVVDFFTELNVPILKHAPRIYAWLTSHALWLYDALFVASDNALANRCMSWMLSRIVRRRLTGYLESIQPDVVISAHPLYVSDAISMARMEESADFILLSMVCDPVSPHRSWACPSVDLCFAPTSGIKDKLIDAGMPTGRVEVSGFPVRSEFLKPHPRAKISELRTKLGLEENSLVVLISSGGNGAGQLHSIVQHLLARDDRMQLIVLTGENRRLKQRLKRLSGDSVTVMSFVENAWDYMIASDIIIGKAGPSTIMESAAAGRPILLTEEVGRQERGNIALARSLGVGIQVPESLNSPHDLLDLTKVSRQLNPPAEAVLGARYIAKWIIEHVRLA
ncbi:MGDG synthase family glycosyltransferase [Streptomyces sp. NBC_00443]|uniref:MGDG synthase family glycosyltransferase n=1 Tax=Streptomyces sp. NBC_00443 TaxID=2975743 RepID=UPI002E22DAC4